MGPDEIMLQTLAHRRFALVGFDAAESARIVSALGRVGAYGHTVDPGESFPGLSPMARFDGCVFNASSPAIGGAAAALDILARTAKPSLMVGDGEEMLANSLGVAGWDRDFLLRPWKPEELLLRIFHVLRQSASDSEPIHPAKPGSKPRVVLADDDATTITLLRALLRSSRVRCEVARDGMEALRLVQKLKPDLLLLDLMMPRLDGFEVLAALQNDPVTRRMPVVILSACQRDEDVVRGLELGARDYITKPCSPPQMLARVTSMIRRSCSI